MNNYSNKSNDSSHHYSDDSSRNGTATLGDPLPIEGDVEPHFVGTEDRHDQASETKRLFKEVGQTAKSKVTEVAQQTTDEVRNRADGYVDDVSGKVRNLEKAVREAAQRTDGEQPQKLTSGATFMADKLDGVAGYLDRKNSREIVEDFGNVVRSNPGLVIGGLALTGFLAGRFLRIGDAQRNAGTNA